MTRTATSQPSSPLTHGSSGKEWKKAHAELQSDETLWNRLNWLGIHWGTSGLIEMRECPCCGSQLGRPIKRNKALELLAQMSGALHRTLDCLSSANPLRRAAARHRPLSQLR